MASSVKTGKTVTGGGNIAGQIVGQILSNPETQQQIFGALFALISGLFKKKEKPPVVLPGEPPQPNPNQANDDFPDDVISAPSQEGRKVTKVVAKLIRAQYSRQRNPEMYSPKHNPKGWQQGLYDNPRQYEGGKSAINIGAKGWVDATAYDADGNEFLRDAVIAAGLQYKTEHHVGDAYIKGNGGAPQSPAEGYETNDTDLVGNGISAWISSMGFLHQVKFHGEGKHEVFVVVDGVKSNSFAVRVS